MGDIETELVDTTTSLEAVLCSICLDPIGDDAHDRSMAKLHCGHQFHLDCIGSAFNMKGAMQCPNCRKVEKGRWLYASGCSTRSVPDISMEDWTLHDDQYPLNFPEIPLSMHWCPISGLARFHSAFEAVESSLPGYLQNLRHQHNMFVEHGPISSVPYVAYFRHAPSNTSETIEDPNFSYQWNGVSNPHIFPVAPDMHYPSNGVHHANTSDQAPVTPLTLRSTRGDIGAMPRSGPHMHPYLYGHGSRSHERPQPSHAIHHTHQPNNSLGMPSSSLISGMPRFHGRRPPTPVPANSIPDGNGNFFIFPSQGSSIPVSNEAENPLLGVLSDRNSGWLSFHNGGGSHGHWS